VTARDSLDAALRGVVEGTCTFVHMVNTTKPQWESLARQLARRWRAPAGVTLEDLIQELHVGAFLAIRRYDATKGKSPREYVVWNAMDRTKKWLHVQRLGHRTHRHEDSTPGRFPRAFSTMQIDGKGNSDLPYAVERACFSASELEPTVAIVAAKQAWRRARESAPILHPVMDAVIRCRGNTEDAADAVYGSTDLRLQYRFGCRQDAVDLVRLAVNYFVAVAQE
jgi:hypothetical protein